MNRLKLDFSLQSEEERAAFLHQYLESSIFKEKPPTEDELEMCGNYVLWGKDSSGLSAVDKGEVQIETRYKTWNRQDEESLEGLLEKPNFVESTLHPITSQKQKKIKDSFSREEALAAAPSYLQQTFQDLFHQIDLIDLTINFYELRVGKRKNPPRQELFQNLAEEEIEKSEKKAQSLNQYQYLNLRHLLVELRRQQYTIRDSYQTTIRQRNFLFYNPSAEEATLGEDIPVLPLGGKLKEDSHIFFDPEIFTPAFSEKEKQKISTFLESKKQEELTYKLVFDFRNLENVYSLIVNFTDIAATSKEKGNENFQEIIDALDYYCDMANLTDCQKKILLLKKKGLKNQDVADIVNKEFGKSYTVNYISTIFRQKIIKKINEAAAFHLKIVENFDSPGNFKRCSTCRRYLLKDPQNFIRKARTTDGYAARCKICDKKVGKR